MHHIQCVLVLADTQIITGVAVLASGFSSLKCRLSAYHWQIIVYLAWFSSVTHLSALTFLRNYLRNHFAEFACRMVLMLVLLALLCTAVIPTSHFDFSGDDGNVNFKPSYFAICFYHQTIDTTTVGFQSMLLFIFLSIYGYTIRLAKMSSWVGRKSQGGTALVAKSFDRQLKAWNPLQLPRHWRIVWFDVIQRPIVLGFLGVLLVQFHIFSSYLAEVRLLKTFWIFPPLTPGSTLGLLAGNRTFLGHT